MLTILPPARANSCSTPRANSPASAGVFYHLPNPFEFESQAKATEGKAGMAAGTASVRRSTAGTGLRVGEAVAVRPATSEFMDVTARRDEQPNSPEMAFDLLGGVAGACSGIKCGENRTQSCLRAMDTHGTPHGSGVTGGESAATNSTSFSSANSFSGIGSASGTSAMLHPGVVDGPTTLALQAGTVVTAGETALNSSSISHLDELTFAYVTGGVRAALDREARRLRSATC